MKLTHVLSGALLAVVFSSAVARTVESPLDENLIFSQATLRTTSAVMQSFDIDFVDSLIYYTQLNRKYRVYVSWGGINATKPEGTMELHYFGHGSNFSLERTSDGNHYIWISSFASRQADGHYWDSRIVSRVPIEDGAVVKPWDTTDNYYFGGTNIAVSVDVDHDRISVLGISTGLMSTYRLSDVQALPVEDIELAPVLYGGEMAPDEETVKTFVVSARDCRKAKPVGEFTIKRNPGELWQGFEVWGDIVIQARGKGNDNDGKEPSNGSVIAFTVDGRPLLPLSAVQAVQDLQALREYGVTDTGYMEAEGVKIRGGKMYLGYASKNAKEIRRGVILQYDIPAEIKDR